MRSKGLAALATHSGRRHFHPNLELQDNVLCRLWPPRLVGQQPCKQRSRVAVLALFVLPAALSRLLHSASPAVVPRRWRIQHHFQKATNKNAQQPRLPEHLHPRPRPIQKLARGRGCEIDSETAT
jgi:hypothetical protein